MAVLITSISPLSGPPGTMVTVTGAGFDAGSQIGCPTLVATTFVSAGEITGAIPADLEGADGSQMTIGLFVMGGDGSVSALLPFVVTFPQTRLQSWTTVDRVVKAVPGFQRGGQIADDDIQGWIGETAQEVAATMVRRGLPLDAGLWPGISGAGMPSPQGLLESINRAGAAAMLAAAIASNFTQGQWAVQVSLQKQYDRMRAALEDGAYDKLFLAAAATLDPGPQLAASQEHRPAFRKDQEF